MKESSMTDLDRIDKNILRRLQSDGRLTNAELAKAVNVSPATCHRRTQALFEDGHVTRVTAQINPTSVDLGTLVMVGVVLDRSTPESFATFEEAVSGMNELLDCHLVAGEFDYLLKIRVSDMNDFNTIHNKMLIALPGVRQIRTFFVLKEIKENAPLAF
ncbi:Lrp/AsnC ligand binding domain-containing protein [Roseibium sp.]|uniref:Lrp/AsnC family transcriptional regulator n=1 Tax=Roseibium sp. TaxID=1936156 RepID=UPI0032659D19